MADYYNDNAAQYFHATVDVDMSTVRTRFLAYLPPGAHMLDAGCGSGRDSLAFLQAGYRVTAFDASPEMATLASQHIGQDVAVMRFQDFSWHEAFDGIWACASLLHVPRDELPGVFQRLSQALKAGGVIYVSFKHGNGDRVAGGRHFTDLDEGSLAELIDGIPDLVCLEQWVSDDRRPGRALEPWFNALLRKG